MAAAKKINVRVLKNFKIGKIIGKIDKIVEVNQTEAKAIESGGFGVLLDKLEEVDDDSLKGKEKAGDE